ncbi:tRNA (adenosine(37)-N6)-threonylcarbamoyltransferase complex dimerization subunit type 1 TsaB [Ursidibacter maritimus]|uniref:tRNA threonylcarbamoyladenosine biosynthesis protein TsaB n=1 Tax=Ursidibacter maritimus TaxID=1331689 RepID=A0A949T304_9PAST|nr:tRNA (adenosine(37)-N6)-threonylcarbamoyltransferase complex dimerization subunit type 1 TsaB [Ursidibacter maritimus]KAE9539075.1 tRNA threonylcarbamoyladenosine biosynthesis protein TsaB [Ursidibacter maritimus]MBV6523728.1 tRNA (adenosine(37)-N6)-threonylcarbamoyltransferase complex dimerization subunit type 1 TsaB [Ursidibacter maritimus]MBV6526007.1 tRNA (adenosine(37)-N6)-threonylcarbamoyltransferase complex dimerization subunit type 1 TsaB [Ursidibacter maritimus]MBV6527922.1 tRNA (ad
MMKTILALDTATEACSVALLHQENISTLDELSPRTHTQRILPMIDELLKQANLTIKQVDLLAFGRGPGSFTGVRVGVGIAQGLALGAELPVVAVSNLLAMAESAYQQLGKTEVVALIDARMNEVYFAQFGRNEDGWFEVVSEQVCSPEKAIEQIQVDRNPVVVGTGWAAYSQFAEANLPLVVTDITLPSARYMLSLAEQAYQQGKTQSAIEIEPVYLRNEVTWQKLPNKR